MTRGRRRGRWPGRRRPDAARGCWPPCAAPAAHRGGRRARRTTPRRRYAAPRRHRSASRVLPTPPTPVRVSIRLLASSRRVSLSSRRRPTKLVSSAGSARTDAADFVVAIEGPPPPYCPYSCQVDHTRRPCAPTCIREGPSLGRTASIGGSYLGGEPDPRAAADQQASHLLAVLRQLGARVEGRLERAGIANLAEHQLGVIHDGAWRRWWVSTLTSRWAR